MSIPEYIPQYIMIVEVVTTGINHCTGNACAKPELVARICYTAGSFKLAQEEASPSSAHEEDCVFSDGPYQGWPGRSCGCPICGEPLEDKVSPLSQRTSTRSSSLELPPRLPQRTLDHPNHQKQKWEAMLVKPREKSIERIRRSLSPMQPQRRASLNIPEYSLAA